MRRVLGLASAAILVVVASVGSATAEPARRGLRQLGFSPLLGTGFNTGVVAHPTRDRRLFAYVGTWGTEPAVSTADACPSETDNPAGPTKSGIKVVDLTKPSKPRLAHVVGVPRGAEASSVAVTRLRTAAFNGDLLAHTLAPCGLEGRWRTTAGPPASDLASETSGVRLYDVSEPTRPVALATYSTGGAGVEDLAIVARPDLGRVFVAALVNESTGPGAGTGVGGLGDLQGRLELLDVTDPRNVRSVSSYAPQADFFVCDARGTDTGCYLKNISVSGDGRTAYLSWWDGGLLVIDISNPAKPQLKHPVLAQADGDDVGWLDEEGNTAAGAVLARDGRRFAVVADDDRDGGSRYAEASIVSPAPLAGRSTAVEWSGTSPLGPKGVSGDVFYAGGGCTPLDYAGAPSEPFIALVEEFDCFEDLLTVYQHKLSLAEQAGATGMIMVTSGQLPGVASGQGIPAASVSFRDGVRLRNRVAPGSPTGVQARLDGQGPVNPWGFVRSIDITAPDGEQWRQVATFKAPHVEDLQPAAGRWFSAHHLVVAGDLVYVAWWSDGVRVLRVDRRGGLQEVGSFLPSRSPGGDPHKVFPEQAGFWGVEVVSHPRTGQQLVLASDVNRGLYVLG